jgi:serine phosphatase RsbU (regulator of sigma subunit)/pSer/pThr/pTyr-binding forkhead associated (FHA) protein
MPYLVQTRGPNVGKTYALTSECTLGRNQDCDVVVRLDSVSRHHARITRLGESYFIEDLQSRNGTSFNNTSLRSKCQLSDGDRIGLSSIEFAFRDTAMAELSSSEARDTDTHITAPNGDSQDAPVHVTIEIPHEVDMSRFATDAHAKLGALLEITQSLGQYLSLDMLLPKILDCLFKMIPQAGSGSVILRDEEGNLVPMWTKTATGSLDQHRISRTIIDRALFTGNAILSNDAYHDPRFLHSESVSDLEIRSIMCAPLIDDEGEAFGVVQVDTGDWEHAFQQEELELLTGVASQAAIAITSARLHENELKRRTLERDLELAAEVQRSILPTDRPQLPGYEFGDWYEPAERIGGDYYDYVPTSDGRLGVIIADVAGHGIASALSMSKLSAEVRMLVSTVHKPHEILHALNGSMCRQGGESRFITLLLTIFDPATHAFQIACAGHMPPLLRTAEGDLREPGRDRFGPPLGAVPDFPYVDDAFSLAVGETLTLYTDGITEATNLAGEVYGESRLRARIVAARCAAETVRTIIADVTQFTGQQSQRDDICLVCIGRT